jgi:hypothetical protein
VSPVIDLRSSTHPRFSFARKVQPGLDFPSALIRVPRWLSRPSRFVPGSPDEWKGSYIPTCVFAVLRVPICAHQVLDRMLVSCCVAPVV